MKRWRTTRLTDGVYVGGICISWWAFIVIMIIAGVLIWALTTKR